MTVNAGCRLFQAAVSNPCGNMEMSQEVYAMAAICFKISEELLARLKALAAIGPE